MKLPGACDGTGVLNKMIIRYFNYTVSQWSCAYKGTELVNTNESCFKIMTKCYFCNITVVVSSLKPCKSEFQALSSLT